MSEACWLCIGGNAILFVFIGLPLIAAYGLVGALSFFGGLAFLGVLSMPLSRWIGAVDKMTGWDVEKAAKYRQPTVIEDKHCNTQRSMPE